ncbi:MAG: HU family DNA-binding protein [Bacteroidota bacterium]|jgi:integration host factor subunit beta|nr:HU family DNA-binding protein [Bacteroidota bacterium]
MKHKIPTRTRKDIARSVAEQLSMRIQDADHVVDTVLTSIRDLLMSADPELRLEVRDFGVFEIKLTKAKPRARNPKTGDSVYVPPRRKTHFKPSKMLKLFLTEPLTAQAEARLIERELQAQRGVGEKTNVADLIVQ